MQPTFDKKRVKAIIFDVDGTLRDTDDEMVRSIELFLLKFEFLIASKKAKNAARYIVMGIESPAQRVLFYADKWDWDTFIHQVIQGIRWLLKPFKNAENYQTIEGIKAMIPALAKHYPLAVASAGDEKTVKNFLENAGILHHFQCVATAITCPHTKPFPDPLIWASLQMGVPIENCLMVGDTTVDMLAGKNAGTQTIAVLCGFGEKAELEVMKPDLIMQTTGDLIANLL